MVVDSHTHECPLFQQEKEAARANRNQSQSQNPLVDLGVGHGLVPLLSVVVPAVVARVDDLGLPLLLDLSFPISRAAIVV